MNLASRLSLVLAVAGSLSLVSHQQASAFENSLTPEQLEILSHLSIVQLDDGQGGTVKTIRLTGHLAPNT